jgi:hypothetical protein
MSRRSLNFSVQVLKLPNFFLKDKSCDNFKVEPRDQWLTSQ